MSLYYVQKLIYELNRNPDTTKRFEENREALLASYDLTDEELTAIRKPDIGLLYVLGVNGQILMHYAALWKIPWDDYLKSMEDGVKEHGPVRTGLYARTEGKLS
ncbi:MAG: aromatic ring-opening dioxygenase subunit LigA [Rhodospirillaceae bacterium]|nr:aromatic ring-opening dioxygenase subunit LigA [Rhodospirillaceae bacterium]OUT76949.1 MAG: aromatic ring-opening dioxygenase subunit LigA [Rhodospirillaceae bacterium TMED23]|tara:strand:- start:3265 stop:3576 length:312 start_codon:yes stop_codon:yes gene_type:complete